jgi:hypothetical protein
MSACGHLPSVTCDNCSHLNKGSAKGPYLQTLITGDSITIPGTHGVIPGVSAKKRSEGERIRARHVIERLRACLQGIDLALDDESTPVGNEAGQAITQTATELAVLLAKLDAYQRTEQDILRIISDI